MSTGPSHTVHRLTSSHKVSQGLVIEKVRSQTRSNFFCIFCIFAHCASSHIHFFSLTRSHNSFHTRAWLLMRSIAPDIIYMASAEARTGGTHTGTSSVKCRTDCSTATSRSTMHEPQRTFEHFDM